jgi:hypothetical protein
MYNTIPDFFRRASIETLFETNTLRQSWLTWQPAIRQILGTNYTENEIINLGDQLSTIFKTTGGTGRGQESLSGGGTAWESLVCWYINLCTVGSRIVAVKKMSLTPSPIQDSITVNYGNFACNTESDITVIVFPNLPDYTTDISQLNFSSQTGQIIQPFRGNRLTSNLLNFLADRDFGHYEVGIIQCKTNWNDNAQIPMLWDMIYSANGFPGRNISIGRNGYSISGLTRFTYSFATVPTNQRGNYNPNSVSVKRVTNLSGGNYWGNSTVPNVARSLKEIFTNNYTAGFNTNLRNDIRNAISHFGTGNLLSYFDF